MCNQQISIHECDLIYSHSCTQAPAGLAFPFKSSFFAVLVRCKVLLGLPTFCACSGDVEIDYYPSRWWAVVPCWLVVGVAYYAFSPRSRR